MEIERTQRKPNSQDDSRTRRMTLPFFRVPNCIFDRRFNKYELLVLIYLLRCGNNGAAHPSYATIARKCGISRRKAIAVVKTLREQELLEKRTVLKHNLENGANNYRVVIEMLPFAQCAPSTALQASPDEGHAPNKEPTIQELSIQEHENESSHSSSEDMTCSSKMANKVLCDQAIDYYFKVYSRLFKEPHPNLRYAQYHRVVSVFDDFSTKHNLTLANWKTMINKHFRREIETDYNINHFATEGILNNLVWLAR